MTRVGLTVTIPDGWTNLGRPPDQYETGLLRIQAPSSYSFAPTYVDLQGSLGRWPDASAQWVIENAIHGPANPPSAQIASCTVAGEPAAFYGYTIGSETGYFVLWLHSGSAFELTVHGNGGVDPSAVADAKAVLGSVTYANAPPTPT